MSQVDMWEPKKEVEKSAQSKKKFERILIQFCQVYLQCSRICQCNTILIQNLELLSKVYRKRTKQQQPLLYQRLNITMLASIRFVSQVWSYPL